MRQAEVVRNLWSLTQVVTPSPIGLAQSLIFRIGSPQKPKFVLDLQRMKSGAERWDCQCMDASATAVRADRRTLFRHTEIDRNKRLRHRLDSVRSD